MHRFPAARAQRAGRHPDAAGRHPHRFHRHASARHEFQSDEPGWHCHRHWRHDRRRHRDDRKRPQTPGTSAHGARAQRSRRRHARRVQGGRASTVLLAPDHHRFLPAGLQPGRSGRPAVFTTGLYQDLRDGRRGAAVDHPSAGADDALHPRQDSAGSEEPGEPLSDLGLSTDHRRRHALEEADHPARRPRPDPVDLSGLPAGLRVHADAQRGHLALHAGFAAGDVDHQGGRIDADPEQDHQELPRGFLGLWQGRARQHRDRPGTDRDVRDGDQPQAGIRMACRHEHRQADRRTRPGAAVSRRGQRLDDADQGAHRHAVHRYPHADRHQGFRQGSRRDGKAGQRDRGGGEGRPRNDQRFRRAYHRRLLPEH